MKAISILAVMSFALSCSAQQQGDWISLCSKCLSPSVTSKSGIGTTNATASGKVTLKDAQMWCGSWDPDNKRCPSEQLAGEKGQLYKISANCPAGKLTSTDGTIYSRTNERWDASDIGAGQPNFRGSGRKNCGPGQRQRWTRSCRQLGVAVWQAHRCCCSCGWMRREAALRQQQCILGRSNRPHRRALPADAIIW